MQKYPVLEVCPKCGRHAIIKICEFQNSMGFMTKQKGFEITNYCFQMNQIDEAGYQTIYQQINYSKLPRIECPSDIHANTIQIKMENMFFEEKKGVRFAAFYQPCDSGDPVKISHTLSEIAHDQSR